MQVASLPVKLSPAVVQSWQLSVARKPGSSDRDQFLVVEKGGQARVFLRNFLQFESGPKIFSVLVSGRILRQYVAVTEETH